MALTFRVKAVMLSTLFLAGCAGPSITSSGEKVYLDIEKVIAKDITLNFTAMTHRKSPHNAGAIWETEFDPSFQADIKRTGTKLLYRDAANDLVLYEADNFGFPNNPPRRDSFKLYVSENWISNSDCSKGVRNLSFGQSREVEFNRFRKEQSPLLQFTNDSVELPFSLLENDEYYEQLKAAGLDYQANTDFGLFYLSRSGMLRRIWMDDESQINCRDYVPRFIGAFDTENGSLDMIYIDDSMGYQHYTFIPSNKLICADLTKNYWHVRKKQGQAFVANLLLAAVQSYTATSTTTYSGTARTKYQGSYANRNFSGIGTSNFSAYSRTYDYSYIGDRAKTALSIALAGSASIDQIKAGMQANSCIIP